MKVVPQVVTVMTPNGPRTRPDTADGFHPVARADAFDRMELQARRRKPDGPPLFTIDQVEAGRSYAALAERVAAEGVRCASLEGRQQGGGSGSWMDGVIQRSERLARMRRAIGDDVALSPRGHRAQADRGRRTVRVRDLVDQVCCEERTLSDVLTRAGWSRQTETLAVLREKLSAALDRMSGL